MNEKFEKSVMTMDPFFWLMKSKVELHSGPVDMANHKYQIDPLKCLAPEQVVKKGAQLGWTTMYVLRTIWGLIVNRCNQGALYLFPTKDDVSDFTKARFNPLIADNYGAIGIHVRDTDNVQVKRVGSGNLYLRGARLTSRSGGQKRTSTRLKSIDVDTIVYDERDEMADSAIDLARERVSHSLVQEQIYLSTPTIPDFGVDKLYEQCLGLGTKVLKTDLIWTNIEDLKVGGKLIGFDEDLQTLGRGKHRKYRETTVIGTKIIEQPCVEIELEDGNRVICSKNHRWLTSDSKGTRLFFKPAHKFRIDDPLISIGQWGTFRPVRLLPKARGLWEGRSVGNDVGCTKKVKINQLKDVGQQQVVALTTQHKTFIANGLLSHNSDQRIFMIKCQHCNHETCLEIEFPNCLKEREDGSVFRACMKCGAEIFPRHGNWRVQYPSKTKDLVGWWISQLNSAYIDPRVILRGYLNPPHGNLTEFYNSKLGMAHIEAENKLTDVVIYGQCGRDPMMLSHPGPCAMGIDVGNDLHVCIACKPLDGVIRVVHIGRYATFQEVHDVAKRFGVQCAVIDLYPEQRKVRDFQAAEDYQIFGCQYQETQHSGPQFDQNQGLVKVNRTEICDETHFLMSDPSIVQLPRRSTEIEVFATEMCNMAKVKETDEESGLSIFRYRKLGPDHYRHSFNYLSLACRRIGLYDERHIENPAKDRWSDDFDDDSGEPDCGFMGW